VRNGISKKAAHRTVKNVLELLRRLINFAAQEQLCTVPSWKIKMPTVNIMKIEDLTPKEMARLVAVLNSEIITLSDGAKQLVHADARDAMRLALATGMRRSEIFSLQWPDIDERRRVINIRNPKGGVDQFIPLPDSAIEVFKQRIKGPSPFVFPSKKKGHRLEAGRQMRLIREAAGLPKNFRPMHGLRHTFASTLASSGEVDLYTIQRLLTHKSPVMTQRYAHLRDETMRKASNLAGKIIEQAAAQTEGAKAVNFTK
jgi:integrase